MHGKICYLEIPAVDPQVSAAFYQNTFGWKIRRRGDGAIAFDDATGAVSDAWSIGRPVSQTVGLLVYIMVENVEDTVATVKKHGGKIVEEIGADAPELIARFLDPAGNIVSLYEEPRSSPDSQK